MNQIKRLFNEIDTFMDAAPIGKCTRHQLFEHNEPHYEVYFDGMVQDGGAWRMQFTLRLYAGYESHHEADENLANFTWQTFEALAARNRWLIQSITAVEPAARRTLEVGQTIYNKEFMIADFVLYRTLQPEDFD